MKIIVEHGGQLISYFCMTMKALVSEKFLKLCKLHCKSNFNRIEVVLLMIDNFETNRIVIYLRGGYMMHLKSTCHVSCIRCRMSLFNHSQTVRSRDQQIFSLCLPHHTMCHVSSVRCHLSLVMCHMSGVTCPFFPFFFPFTKW